MLLTNMRLAVLGLVLVMGTLPAQATIIDVHFTFNDPNWSAAATYDDTSGQPWTGPGSGSITAYALNTLEVTLAGVATWDFTDLFGGPSTPPDGGLLKDLAGELALHLDAYDPASGLALSALLFVFAGAIIQPIVVALDADGVSVSASQYIARVDVPEPAAFAMMGLGLAGIGYRRRQLKKA